MVLEVLFCVEGQNQHHTGIGILKVNESVIRSLPVLRMTGELVIVTKNWMRIIDHTCDTGTGVVAST